MGDNARPLTDTDLVQRYGLCQCGAPRTARMEDGAYSIVCTKDETHVQGPGPYDYETEGFGGT